MKIDSVEFVRSATGAGDLPRHPSAAAEPGAPPGSGLPEIAMVGRSNVGKSSLINALLKTTVARTSATPGKTRLINLYRVLTKPTGPFYVVDLPGYGFTKGKNAKQEFDRLAAAYFQRASAGSSGQVRRVGQVRGLGRTDPPHQPDPPYQPVMCVILAVDCRHPGMENDLATCTWLRSHGFDPLVVVTKLDKLSRSVRAKTIREFDHLFGTAVVGVSAETGEGMEDLWKRILSWILPAATGNSPRRSHL